MKNKKKILMSVIALVLSVILFGYQVPNVKAAEPTTVEFLISPAGDMVDGEMPVTFQPVGEQPSIELIASNVESITNGSLVIEDYQSSNNYTESFDSTTIDPVYDFISFTGSDSAIGLKIGLDGNGFLYHYASIGEGASITLTFDIELNNTTNYVDITYMLDDVVVETKKQKKDDIPNLPLTEPTKYGFIFKGWYLEPEFTTAITLETRFTANTIVYGYLQEKTLISVKYYDGESIISQGMQYSTELLLKPSNPVKSGHVFMGWYLDPEFTTKLENDAKFDEDVNIYAKFIADSGGAVIPTEENNKTLYLVGAAALLLIVFIAISSTKGNKPTKKKGK